MVDEALPYEPKPKGKLVLPPGLGPMQRPHRDYLLSRNFDPDHLARLWGVRGIGLAAHLAWRLFLPVTHRGLTVSWTTRALTDEEQRYVNARPEQEALPIKSLLFGADLARHAVIVVEGPLDCMRIGPGAVATLGVGHSKEQAAAIAQYPVRAVVFDAEFDAQQRAQRLCADLSVLPGKTVRVEIDAADPGSASPKEVRLLRKAFLE